MSREPIWKSQGKDEAVHLHFLPSAHTYLPVQIVYASDLCEYQYLEQADKLENVEISKEEYDKWRYKYPELDTYQKRAKVPSQELSDYLVKELTKKEN